MVIGLTQLKNGIQQIKESYTLTSDPSVAASHNNTMAVHADIVTQSYHGC